MAVIDIPLFLMEREQNIGEITRDGKTASVEIVGEDRLARRLRGGYPVFASASQRSFAQKEAGRVDTSADDVGVQIGQELFWPGPQWRDRRSD